MADDKYQLNQLAIRHSSRFPGRPTIVFLHDSLGSIELWRDFPEKLCTATGCNALIYDRHGYGKSGPLIHTPRESNYMEVEADILAEIILEYKLSQVVLFGHSDGGTIALLAAAKHPELVAAVITEGAHIFVENETLQGIRQAIDQYKSTGLKSKLEKYHGTNTDEMFNAWAQTWTADFFRNWNIEKFLPLVTCPTLVIQGEQDEFGTTKQVSGIANGISGKAETFLVPNAKHTPHKETGQVVIEKCADFIKAIFG